MRAFASAMLALASIVVSTGVSSAATVRTIKPTVAVNQGEGFRSGPAQFNVGPGDKVMVEPGGLAQVTYDDGCAVEVEPGQVYTVESASPCKSGTSPKVVNYLLAGGAVAGIAVGVIALSDDGDDGGGRRSRPASP